MVMVVDTTSSTIEVGSLRERLTEKGHELGIQITVQHEDIFKFMHRI